MRRAMVWLWVVVALGVGIAGYRYLASQLGDGIVDKPPAPPPAAKTADDQVRDAKSRLPLAGRVSADAPNRAELAARLVLPELAPALHARGLRAGDPIFIRIFKEERALELWILHRAERRFRLFKTYRVEGMSGEPGPKLAEGDRQAPEGFYFVDRRRMNPNSNYHLAFNLGYPNAYDREHGRTGSFLMVHGSWVSVGCFAMTDYGIEEIYTLADAALAGGQAFFRVHIFPFRMTDAAMAEKQGHRWFAFWQNLREGYDYFERGHLPPDVRSAAKRYVFADAAPLTNLITPETQP